MKWLVTALALSASALAADWNITYSLPKNAEANFNTQLIVDITDANKAPVEDAKVDVILTMVDMDHGESKSVAKQVKPGVYTSTIKFLMAGSWWIEVRAKKGTEEASKKFRHEITQ